jgi:SAM-dependent methyltransferase
VCSGDVRPGLDILDVGSGGSFLPVYLGVSAGCRVVSIDLADPRDTGADAWRRSLNGWSRRNGGRSLPTAFTRCDAGRLPFRDASFDRVFVVSTIEHMPGEGDSVAAREIGRVLRPGGLAVISVPVGWAGMRETASSADSEFFERQYDLHAVRYRLVKPSGLQDIHAVLLGERLPRFGVWLNSWSRETRNRWGWLVSLMAFPFWGWGPAGPTVDVMDEVDPLMHWRCGVVCMTLRKPGA